MIDAVAIIKNRLDMPQVLSRYGFGVSKRMKCPIHNGQDLNFEVKKHSWRCYSHCGGGDVISFVQKIYGLTFPEALRKLDADFALGIYEKPTLKRYRELQRIDRELKKKQAEAAEKAEINRIIWDVLCEKRKLYEKITEYWAPKTPDEEPLLMYVETLNELPYIEYLLDKISDSEEVINLCLAP